MNFTAITLPAWMDDAACVDENPETFFPPTGQTGHRARQICKRCPVATQCLTFAIETEDGSPGWGIYGGTTPEQRRKAARKVKR